MSSQTDPSLAELARRNSGVGGVQRDIYDLLDNPAGPSVLNYAPAPGEVSGVEIGVAHRAAIGVQLREDLRRRTTLVDVATLADSEAYGLDVNGTTDTKTSDSDATVPEVVELMRKLVAGLSEPVWAERLDRDDDGEFDTLKVEGLWSKFYADPLSDNTDYAIDVTYVPEEGLTTETVTASYTSGSGATQDSITAGVRDSLNSVDAPIRAEAVDTDSSGDLDTIGVEPTTHQNVALSVASNLIRDATHSTSDYSIADNSTGGSADLTVLPEATSATFSVYARHESSGYWERIRGAESISQGVSWTEVLGSLNPYDRADIVFESLDGRAGAFVEPAVGSS